MVLIRSGVLFTSHDECVRLCAAPAYPFRQALSIIFALSAMRWKSQPIYISDSWEKLLHHNSRHKLQSHRIDHTSQPNNTFYEFAVQ